MHTMEKERLTAVLDELPQDRAQELLDFAEFLYSRLQKPNGAGERLMGLDDGKIVIHPSFYDELPGDILDAFCGKEI